MRARTSAAVVLALVATIALQPRSIFEPPPFVAEAASPDTLSDELAALHGAAAAVTSCAVEVSSRAWHGVARVSSAVATWCRPMRISLLYWSRWRQLWRGKAPLRRTTPPTTTGSATAPPTPRLAPCNCSAASTASRRTLGGRHLSLFEPDSLERASVPLLQRARLPRVHSSAVAVSLWSHRRCRRCRRRFRRPCDRRRRRWLCGWHTPGSGWTSRLPPEQRPPPEHTKDSTRCPPFSRGGGRGSSWRCSEG